MNNILSLINPARIIKVEDARKIAWQEILQKTGGYAKMSHDYAPEINERALRILQSFESLYDMRLEKGHFVVDEQEFTNPMDGEQDLQMFEHAKAKVIFEGFESYYQRSVRNKESGFTLEWDGSLRIYTSEGFSFPQPATIGDLFHAIEVYNRTATTPIELKYTENILKLLKIEV